MTGFDAAEFIFNGAFSDLWPIVVLPALACLISGKAARRLPPTRADWRVAASLCGLPGLVMATLCAMAIFRSAGHLHAGDLEHDIQFRITPLIALAWVCRAIVLARRRSLQLARVAVLGTIPGPRLEAAAKAVGVHVRELPTDACECFVAGLRRMTVFVSKGAVSRMTDAELRAALYHERAHALALHPAIFAVLCFLCDLAPGSGRAMEAYRQASERFADSEAVKSAGPLNLASALLVVAKSQPPVANVVSIASPGAGTWRLNAILGIETREAVPEAASAGIAASLALNSFLAAWPLPHIYLAYIFCS